MKEWLFNFYSLIGNYDSYNKINKRLFDYRNNMRKAAYTEDIMLRNLMILDQRNQKRY